VQAGGQIVAGGDTAGHGGTDVGLVGYRPDGRLDRSFGTNGVVITPVSSGPDEVGGLALQAAGGLASQAAGGLLRAVTAAVRPTFGIFVVPRFLLHG